MFYNTAPQLGKGRKQGRKDSRTISHAPMIIKSLTNPELHEPANMCLM